MTGSPARPLTVSMFVPTPLWKSLCVVSVGQALVGASSSEKS